MSIQQTYIDIMSINFTIDTEQKLILGKAQGVLNHSQLLDIVDEMIHHPDYDAAYNEIWDIRKVSDLRTFFGETRQRVETEKVRRKLKIPNRDAIVVSNPEHFNIVRKYAVLAQSIPLDVEVFYDYKEALKWVREGR